LKSLLESKLAIAIIERIFGERCSACGTFGELRSGHFTRAYNEMCQQAAGASGKYCNGCSTIHFDEPDFDKWMATQPKWIIAYLPYPNNMVKIRGGL